MDGQLVHEGLCELPVLAHLGMSVSWLFVQGSIHVPIRCSVVALQISGNIPTSPERGSNLRTHAVHVPHACLDRCYQKRSLTA